MVGKFKVKSCQTIIYLVIGRHLWVIRFIKWDYFFLISGKHSELSKNDSYIIATAAILDLLLSHTPARGRHWKAYYPPRGGTTVSSRGNIWKI